MLKPIICEKALALYLCSFPLPTHEKKPGYEARSVSDVFMKDRK